tara:strand:+ start:477 stop:662 length:186 start_codon:yes stop_codon:yes gene_type:complete
MQLKKNNFFSWFFGPPAKKSLEEMSKLELEAEGREIGIELDRRRKKEVLVEQLKKQMRKQK